MFNLHVSHSLSSGHQSPRKAPVAAAGPSSENPNSSSADGKKGRKQRRKLVATFGIGSGTFNSDTIIVPTNFNYPDKAPMKIYGIRFP